MENNFLFFWETALLEQLSNICQITPELYLFAKELTFLLNFDFITLMLIIEQSMLIHYIALALQANIDFDDYLADSVVDTNHIEIVYYALNNEFSGNF